MLLPRARRTRGPMLERRADRPGDGRDPRPHRGALAAPRTLRYTQAIVNPGARRAPRIEHPHGQLLGHVLRPRASWSRSRPASPASPGGACCAPRSTPRRTSAHRVDLRRRPVRGRSARSGAARRTRCWSSPATHEPHLHQSPAPDRPGRRGRGHPQRASASLPRPARRRGLQPRVPLRALPGHGEPYHWHVHIWPKATTTAGFELGTGVLINIVSPEEAADTLKVSAMAR